LSQSKQHTGSYRLGFIAYAALALLILLMLRIVSRKWTRTWVGAGGRALTSVEHTPASLEMDGPGMLTT
jgi:NNP family nitrate/nitrite transporter-like MFS transporter